MFPNLDWRLLPATNNIDQTSAYTGSLDPWLVVTSILVAILASFAALSLGPRIVAAKTRRARWAWSSAGALSLGGGIWAMHFIGMLAFSLPCGIDYDPFGTILSMLPSIFASAVALNIISRVERPRFARMFASAVWMGLGIGAMHYSGMATIESASVLLYEPITVLISVVVAIALAFVSLAIRFYLTQSNTRDAVASLAAASVMGCAIAGMHYTAMGAATFVPLPEQAPSTMALPPGLLALLITAFAGLLIISTLVAAFAGRQNELAISLRSEVTRREEMEYEARSQGARLRAILDAVVDAIVTVDTEGRIQQWSSGAQRIFGYTGDEIMGQSLTMLMPEPHHQQQAVGTFLRTRNAKVIGKDNALIGVRKNGEEFPIELGVSEVRIGNEIFFTSILRDITERKQSENELIRAREQAESANEAKSQFLATMSHEIRTPMNGVLGMANLLASTPLNDRQRRLVENVMRSGQALLAIINDILDFSKIEARRLELSAVEFDPRELIAELTDLFGERCSRKGLEFIYYVADDVPPRLRGDPVRLRQILINLVGNAIKFTEHGEILIELALLQRSGENVTLSFSVQDTGIGIPPKEHERIFESFHQVDGSMSRARGGSGLGLAISKQLVELMNGKITIESEPGRGSRFSFTARLERVATNAADTLRKVDRALRVLLVDTNMASAHISSLNLTSWGVAPEATSTAEEAIALWEEAAGSDNPFEVAIIDVKGLGSTGVDLANVIRASKQGQPTTIIFLVGMDGSVSDATLAAIGVYAALPKPADPAELFACLAALGSNSRQAGETPVFVRHNTLTKRPHFDARILIAEDNAVNQEVAMGMLEAMGCRFVTAKNGREAVQLFAQEKFDLVLMDCEMPQMDGFEATRRIREFENLAYRLPSGEQRAKRTPIVALTAHALAEVREKCLAAGMDGFLVKPFEERRLHEMMRRWIGALEHASAPDLELANTGRDKTEPPQTERSGAPTTALEATETADGNAIDTEAIAGIRAMDIKGTGELLKRIVVQFSETAPVLAATISEKFAAGDSDAVWRAAHSLKSSAAATGARKLSQRCGEIENLARAAETERVRPLLADLDTDLRAALHGLKELV